MGKRVLVLVDPDEVGKLHCDECQYDLPDKITWGAHLIGHRCPNCGANMLTVKDYLDTERMFRFIRWLNKWFGWLGAAPGTKRFERMTTKIAVKVHDGKLNVEEKPR